MKASELDLGSLYGCQENMEQDYERIITVPTSALGTLRLELIETIGAKRTKGFLLRYGWHCGASDGSRTKKMEWDSDEELLLAGPKLHTLHGNVQVIPLIVEVNISEGRLYFEGHWKNSYEAREHIKLFGYSTEPVCHSLVGYASGYLSTVMGKKVIAKEIQCMGMGDEHCHWICQTIEHWDGEIQKELKYYELNNIIDELDQTYKELKFERDNLNKAYNVNQRLTKEVLRENDLKSIAHVLYQSTGMAVFIEDSQFNLLAAGGISLQKAQPYSHALKKWVSEYAGQNEQRLDKTTLLNISPNHRRAITPIYLRQRIVGYCSFLYTDLSLQEVDKMILGRSTLVCSIIMLNERTRVQAEQRMRGSLLEEIISKQITAHEMIKRAHHVDFHIHETSSFFMISFNRFMDHRTIKEELDFNDQFIDDLSSFFQLRNRKALIGQKSGHVIILLMEDDGLKEKTKKEDLCSSLLQYCSQKYSDSKLKVGISSSAPSIEEAINLYEESMACLKIAFQHQDIIWFDSLGIVGILFQTRNSDALQKFAYKTLGNLLKEDRSRNMELTKTLYAYLSNACNVQKTSRAINFSLSGLRYRLMRINEILQIDINHPYNQHQIFLALQSLIVLGELHMDEKKGDCLNDFGL